MHVVRSHPEFENLPGIADLGLSLTLAAIGGIHECRRDRNLCKMRHFWIARAHRPLAMRFVGVALECDRRIRFRGRSRVGTVFAMARARG